MGPVVLGQNKRLFLHILMVFIVLSLQACAVTYLISQSISLFATECMQREKEVKKKNNIKRQNTTKFQHTHHFSRNDY